MRGFSQCLAYWSAQAGDSEFTARLYAKGNYDFRPNEPYISDTYGYVKMAFAARKIPPNFDEILEAKRLFEEAISYIKAPTDEDKGRKLPTRVVIEHHLDQAKDLLNRRQ